MTHLWLLLFLNSWFKSEAQGFGMNLIKVPDDDRGQTICTVALLGKYFHSGESLSGFVLHMSITSAATHVQQSLLQALHTDPNYSWTIVVNEARRDYDAATVPQFVMHEKPQCYFIVIENMEDEDLDEMFENWKSNLNWNPLAQFVVYLSAVEESEEEMTDIMIEILLNFMNKKIYNVNIIGQSEESSYYYGKTVFPYHPDNNCGNRVISIETLDLCDYQESEKEDDEEEDDGGEEEGGEEDGGEEDGGEEEVGEKEEGDKEGGEEKDGKREDGEEEDETEDGGEEEDGEKEQGKEEGVDEDGVDKIGGEEEGGKEEGGMYEDGEEDGGKEDGGEEEDDEKEQKKEEGVEKVGEEEDGGEQMGGEEEVGEEEGGKKEDGEEDGGKEDGREEEVGDEDEEVGEEEKGKEDGVDEEVVEKICGGEKGGEEEGGEEGGKDGNENNGKEGGGEKKVGEEGKEEGGDEEEGKEEGLEEEGVGEIVDEDNEEKMGAEEDGREKESGEENVVKAEGGEDEFREEGGGKEEAMGEGVKEEKGAAEEGKGLEEQNGAEEKKEVENGERESSVKEQGEGKDGDVAEESETDEEVGEKVVEEGVVVDKDVVAAELEVVVDERDGNGRGKRQVEEKKLREKEKVVIGREIVLVNALVDKGVVKKGEIWKEEKVMKSKDIAEEKEKVQKEAVVKEKRSVVEEEVVKSENTEEVGDVVVERKIVKVKCVSKERILKKKRSEGDENEEEIETIEDKREEERDQREEEREEIEDIEEDYINGQENEGEEEKENIGEHDALEKEESDDTDDDKEQKTDVDMNSQETSYNTVENKETTAPHEPEYIDPTSTTLTNVPSQPTTSSNIDNIEVISTTVSNIPQHQTTTSEIEDTDETATIKDRLETTQSYEFHDIDETSTTASRNTLHPTTLSEMEYTPSKTNDMDDTADSPTEVPNLSDSKISNDSIYPKLYVEELYRALFLDKFPKDLSGCPLVAAYRPWEPYIFNEALETTENFENSSNSEATNSVNDNNDTSSYGGEGNDGDGDYIVYSESQNTDSEGDGEVPTDSVEVRLNGIEYKMIQTIAERLHISIEMQVENTNLYHLFQQLIDGDIEMVVGGIDEDPSISQFVSSTVPYHQDDLTWCVAKANHTHNLFNFMSTFQSGAWLLTLLFILTASLNILMSRKLLKLRLGLLKSYFSINIYVMGIILSQAIHLRPIPTCLKICFGATFFMGLMFSNVYQSFLVSTLTTPKSSYQISHLQEIYQNRMQIMGSVDNVRHLNKEGETYRYVREQFQMCYNIEECLQRTATDAKLAVAVSRQHSFYNPRIPRDHLYCFDRNENIYVYLVTMLMPKKFHLLHKINPVIQHIIESGHMQKWARDLDMRRKITEEIQRAREEPFKSLTINQVGGSFVLHNSLLTLAICVFLVEHLICWLVVKRKTRLKLAKLCHRKFV